MSKFKNLVYKSPSVGDVSGAILKIFIGETVGNILPTRLIFWQKHDDPLIVLRDLFATEEERTDNRYSDIEKQFAPTHKISVAEGGGVKKKTIYGTLYNEIKDNIRKLTEEKEDLEFIIENYEELKKTEERAVERTKIKTEKNIEQHQKKIKENYEILKKLNIVKLDYVTFLLKKNKKLYTEFMKKIKKMNRENKNLKSIKEIKLFNTKILDMKNKLSNS
mgnify:CR=1 FL=1|tara:strand:+ start:126 stop:785 length:660 start_codon:yes stop_codon:yes gene_type:complete